MSAKNAKVRIKLEFQSVLNADDCDFSKTPIILHAKQKRDSSLSPAIAIVLQCDTKGLLNFECISLHSCIKMRRFKARPLTKLTVSTAILRMSASDEGSILDTSALWVTCNM